MKHSERLKAMREASAGERAPKPASPPAKKAAHPKPVDRDRLKPIREAVLALTDAEKRSLIATMTASMRKSIGKGGGRPEGSGLSCTCGNCATCKRRAYNKRKREEKSATAQDSC